MTERPCVYLVDGSSYIFRFTTMTLKFLKRYQPVYLAVLLDAGRVTFRNHLYQEYKSNRPEAPPDLIPQFPYIRKALQAMHTAVRELQGYEADDLIAPLSGFFS